MELLLKEGDYVPDGVGGLKRVSGEEETRSRIIFRLCARRGMFPFLPRLGSELYRLGAIRPTERLQAARQFVAEAIEEATITDLELTEAKDHLDVHVRLRLAGKDVDVSVPTEGMSL